MGCLSVALKINLSTSMKIKIYKILFLLFLPLLTLSQEPVKLLTSTTFNNGELIPEAKTASEWEQLSMSNQPVFMKKLVNVTEYYFYNWYAVTDNRGIINEKLMIPNQNEIVIWNAYSPIEIVPVGIVSEQGAFTKVTDQQYFWTITEYNEKGKRESAVSVSISNSTIGETELKQAYKQEGFLVLVVETEKMKATTKSVAQTILNNNKISSQIASQPTTIDKQNVTSNNPTVIASNYKSVKIGNQIWMTENLNVDRFRNGDLIPEAKTAIDWELAGKNNQPAWCYYDNDPANGEKYGKLYNWFAVNDSRGLAPAGWKIPKDSDWSILINYIGGAEVVGEILKASKEWVKGTFNNAFGFSALPAGIRDFDGYFKYVGLNCDFWTSDTNNSDACSYMLDVFEDKIFRLYANKYKGFSVRCIRD
jgi:uncharacterized protein (TIGR02145 family)